MASNGQTHAVRAVLLALVALLLALPVLPVYASVAAQPAPEANAATAALDWLRGRQNTDGGFPGFGGAESDPGDSADAAYAFLSAAVPLGAVRREGGASLRDYLGGVAPDAKAGQAAKVILAVAASGDDPRRAGGGSLYPRMLVNYAAGADATTFTNALVVLAVAAVEGPDRARQLSGDTLLQMQGDDGGWTYSGSREGSDTNTTALVVQALVASGQGGEATTRGMAYLEGTVRPDGLYPFDRDVGEGDANSTAYVLQAKIAARSDPAEIERATRALATLQRPSGAFDYQRSMPGENLLATLQAIPALNGRAFPTLRAVPVPLPLPLPVAASMVGRRATGGGRRGKAARIVRVIGAFRRRPPTADRRRDTSGVIVLLVAALLAGLLTGSAAPLPVRAAGAVGIVVRHGDGRLRYAYVPFAEETITGAEALRRANFALNVQASGTLGVAICKIEGEGCDAPREDCFCRSYSNPAFYWHYYTRAADGTWRSAALGAGNRTLRNGDVDGWSWTANTPNLPPVTLAEIAALTQGTQAMSGPPVGNSPQPAVAMQPEATSADTPVPLPSSDTATALPIAIAITIAAATPTTVTVSLAAPTITPVLTTATTATATIGAIATAAAPMPTPADLTPRAAMIGPNGTAVLLTPTPAPTASTGDGRRGVEAFVLVAAAMLLLVALVPRLARRRGRR